MFDRLVGDARSLGWVWQFWPVLCTSLLGSLLGTMAFRRVALRFHVVDKPDSFVKTHEAPVAYLGGLGMLTGLVAGVLVGIRCLDGAQASLDAPRWLMGIVAGAIIAALVATRCRVPGRRSGRPLHRRALGRHRPDGGRGRHRRAPRQAVQVPRRSLVPEPGGSVVIRAGLLVADAPRSRRCRRFPLRPGPQAPRAVRSRPSWRGRWR